MDELAVMVEMKPQYAHLGPEPQAEVKKHLAHRIKTLIGVSAAIRIQEVGGIERSVGKAKRVIDKRPK